MRPREREVLPGKYRVKAGRSVWAKSGQGRFVAEVRDSAGRVRSS